MNSVKRVCQQIESALVDSLWGLEELFAHVLRL